MTPDVRKQAHAILSALEKNRPNTLDRMLDDARQAPGMSRRDKAFLQALVFGVLRCRNRLDWIIRHFSKTPFKKISPRIKNVLRLGIYQMLYMDRVPDSAAVNTSVEMAKSLAAPWTARFVNGLLRNVGRNHTEVCYPDMEKNPALSLSVNQSLPEWLVRRWLKRFGRRQCLQLCEAINSVPPLTIRTNTLKTTRTALMKSLAGAADLMDKTKHSPEGIVLTGPGAGVSEMKPFARGLFQVQDEAAQLVAHVLGPRPGQRVLDACAGLGGKTGHIAQLMENRGEIIALDSVEEKLAALEKEMARLGISIVKTLKHDLNDKPGQFPAGSFDRILLDAPCSGLGVLRRNPDTRWHRSESDLRRYSANQLRYLKNLAPLVKQGGFLVYAVCSMEPEETETVVRRFLSDNRSFVQADIRAEAVNGLPAVVAAGQCIRTLPYRHGMDGFYAVCLRHCK